MLTDKKLGTMYQYLLISQQQKRVMLYACRNTSNLKHNIL